MGVHRATWLKTNNQNELLYTIARSAESKFQTSVTRCGVNPTSLDFQTNCTCGSLGGIRPARVDRRARAVAAPLMPGSRNVAIRIARVRFDHERRQTIRSRRILRTCVRLVQIELSHFVDTALQLLRFCVGRCWIRIDRVIVEFP